MKLLVANRGEIAIRILRGAADLGIETVGIASADDTSSPHLRAADEVAMLPGEGPRAYLDIDSIIDAARRTECTALHPGYGFLAESPALARNCIDTGILFVGPRPDTLDTLGDKAQSRDLAEKLGIPILPGATTLGEAEALLGTLGEAGALMVKAVAGGGGRGLRKVENPKELAQAWERCASEAELAFGNGSVYAEQLLRNARHIEIQILGDSQGSVVALGDRECSLQRRNQKLVEIAPSPSIDDGLRHQLCEASLKLARHVKLQSLTTFEFLVDASPSSNPPAWTFMEANPRIQVEHAVTEEIFGVDLVHAQLQIAGGASLEELGLSRETLAPPSGFAIETRINLEVLQADGSIRPSTGTLTRYEPPTGPGIRLDGAGHTGYQANPRFDSLLAKLIVHSPSSDYDLLVRRTERALSDFHVEGAATNLDLLRALLAHPDVRKNQVTTSFLESHLPELTADRKPAVGEPSPSRPGLAGVQLGSDDPLAVLDHGKSSTSRNSGITGAAAAPARITPPPGTHAVEAPLQGTIVSVDVAPGDQVYRLQPLVVMEAMKMEHVIVAEFSGIVRAVGIASGDTVFENHPLVFLELADIKAPDKTETQHLDLDTVRPDLDEVHKRHAFGLDSQREDAVARRRKTGQRTARENVDHLCDPDTFIEYGSLTLAAQRRRRELDDLIRATPADGMITGVGSVNGAQFTSESARCAILSYDYTVLAGTQGLQNHRKKDRMFEIAEQSRLPVVLFTEGGGGRPGDTDGSGVAGLDCHAFQYFGRLSGLVPLVGINSGRCFAGNAALLGCCDVVIATENSNIGMGGPAMIEGGGLGIFRPEEVGPIDVQVANGVVDIPVADEAEAVDVAKRYLSYFQGAIPEWECTDSRELRSLIPENRLRIYDVRKVIQTLADTDSVLELRRGFAAGMITALARIEGRPVGIVANNPVHLAGAIDAPGADKASRFMQLCDAFDIPLLFLCDTPGIMVGPESERSALVRHASRMFVTGASLTVPFFTIVLRKGYGLGAQAMAGGSFHAPFFTISWPTGEFGGMGLEGAVKLGFRKELQAEKDPEARKQLYEEMVARMYEHGKAINMASHFEIDEVIDPADSRRWITRGLLSAPPPTPRTGKKRPCIDTW